MSAENVKKLEYTINECESMMKYARANGKPIKGELQVSLEKMKIRLGQMKQRSLDTTIADFVTPPSKGEPSDEEVIKELSKAHQDLSVAIYPALPSAVMTLEEGQKSALRFLGPVPLVRRMMVITILCLAGFLALFLSPQVDSKSVASDILSMKDWLEFALNETVIVFAAALGASFYALFEAYKYVSNASYDPRYESIYWIRFTLGIVSGVILAQFIFQPTMTIEEVRKIQEAAAQAIMNNNNLSMPQTNNGAGVPNMQGLFTYSPLLAFLGGFSARVVHKILNSLVDSVESFISGSARDLIRAREESAKVQLEDKLNSMKQQTAAKDASNKMQSALQLLQLQQQVNAGVSNDQIKAKLEELIDGLVTPISGQAMFTTTTTTPVVNNPVSGGGEFKDVPPVTNPPVTTTTTTTTTPPVTNNPIVEAIIDEIPTVNIPDHPEDSIEPTDNNNPPPPGGGGDKPV